MAAMGTVIMDNALLRLLHLVSPTLPTGAFSYSQGLEWAVERGWVNDGIRLEQWLLDLAENSMASVDIPILSRMYTAIKHGDVEALRQWIEILLACRESSELQQEEQIRGRAFSTLLENLILQEHEIPQSLLKRSQLAGFALAAVCWDISVSDAALGYTWAWLENQMITGVKIIPLGQTEGQQILLRVSAQLPAIVQKGLRLSDNEIGASSPALALCCSRHETQYTKLYRS